MNLLRAVRQWFQRPMFDARALRVICIQPGDLVMLKTPAIVTDEEASRLQKEWGAAFPNGPKLLVVARGFDCEMFRASAGDKAPQHPGDRADQCNQGGDDRVHADLAAVPVQPVDGGIERSA